MIFFSFFLFVFISYVRDLNKQEKVFMLHYAKLQLSLNWAHKYEYLPYRSAYLFKENSEDDVAPSEDLFRDTSLNHEFGSNTRSLNNIYN